jgi:hypothetical protein
MTPRFACCISVVCPDAQSASDLLQALQGRRDIRVGMGSSTAPDTVVLTTTVRAKDARLACDVAEARLVSQAGIAVDRHDLYRTAARLRLVAPFTWRTSTDERDKWGDGGMAGDREPRRPRPGSDSASA